MKPIGPNVFDFDTLIDRSSTISIKWSSSLRQKMYGDSNVIPMGIADMDFKCAPSVVAAINKRATHETYGYGFSSEAYLDACVNWQKRRNHWMIESDWITYIPGINMAIVVAVEMFTEPREKVIIQSPVYYPYYDYVTYKGRQIAFNPLLNKDGRYETDFSELEKIASQKDTRMLILCSPHNPVGRCWEKDEPKMVHEICERNNVKVVVDEIHSDLILGKNKFIPYATISEMPQTIALSVLHLRRVSIWRDFLCLTSLFRTRRFEKSFAIGWLLTTYGPAVLVRLLRLPHTMKEKLGSRLF